MINITNKVSLSKLHKFFNLIKDEPFFRPHSFDVAGWAEQAKTGDEYWWVVNDYAILAYGFIRGWGEKWPEKVVGICVHPDLRGEGFGELMLRWLEKVAWNRGLSSLRIHVRGRNLAACCLYKKLGYSFGVRKTPKGDLVGRKKL